MNIFLFCFKATKDPYYLEVGKHVIDTLEDHARVKCGYAAFKDLRTFAHDDKWVNLLQKNLKSEW